MDYRRFALFALVFAAGFAVAHFTRARPQRLSTPDAPAITTVYVRGPTDAADVLHKFSTDTSAQSGDVAVWCVGADGKTIAAGYVLTAINTTR